MGIVSVNDYGLSDLVQYEDDGTGIGITRDMVTVESASAATYPLGYVVCRAKGADPTVVWTPVDATADLVDTNEFAVPITDELQFVSSITFDAGSAGKRTVAAIVRGEVILKEWLIKDYCTSKGITAAADFAKLKHLLSKQGVLVEKTYR